MKKFKILIIVLIVLSTSLYVAWELRYIFLKMYNKQIFWESNPEKVILDLERHIMEDDYLLSEYEIFKPSKGIKDAGTFLNPKVLWAPPNLNNESLKFPDLLKKELDQLQGEWTTSRQEIDPGLFLWMNELLIYDHWSLGPQRPEVLLENIYSPNFSLPDYTHLLRWAKLRLLANRRQGDTLQALKEVRHLARLIFTNDSLVAAMTTLSILKIERKFIESLGPKVKFAWHIFPQDHDMNARRYFYGISGLLDVRLTKNTLQIFKELKAGICLMVNEGIYNNLIARSFLDEAMKDNFQELDDFIAITSIRCQKSSFVNLWKDSNKNLLDNKKATLVVLQEFKTTLNTQSWELLRDNRDAREAAGYLMIGIGKPNSFSKY